MRSLLPAALLAALLAYGAGDGHAQAARLLPVDEAARDPSFFTFRVHLLDALQRRDTAFLYGILSPEMRNSFGGGRGVADFRARWKPGEPTSELWGVLTRVLALGGTFDARGRFVAPYVFSRFPEEYDPFEHAVVVGEGVPVHARPDPQSPVVATLRYDVVGTGQDCADAGGEREGWTAVTLADGTCGYVAERYVRSPLDHRAIFGRTDGGWVLLILVAGD